MASTEMASAPCGFKMFDIFFFPVHFHTYAQVTVSVKVGKVKKVQNMGFLSHTSVPGI